MEKNYLTICDLNNTDTFIASSKLVAEAKAKNAKQYANIAYTDYGELFSTKLLYLLLRNTIQTILLLKIQLGMEKMPSYLAIFCHN